MSGRSPTGPGSRPSDRASKAVSAVPASIPNAAHFDSRQWTATDLHFVGAPDFFHDIEVQSCSATGTIQFGVGDYSGDYHREEPGTVALSLTDAEELARWILEQVAFVRAAQGTEARRAETGTGSVHDGPVREADAPEPNQPSSAKQP